MTGTNEANESAMRVGCPTCGAAPQEPCIGEGNWYLHEAHVDRVQAAMLVAAMNDGQAEGAVHEATAAEIDEAAIERLF